MKIKAKENDGNRITKGKTYVVIEELADVYEIICDTGNHYCAIKSIFDVVDEEKNPMRKGKLLNKFELNRCSYTDDIVFVKDDPNDVDSYIISKTEDFICCYSVFKGDIELLDDNTEEKKPMRVKYINNIDTQAEMLTFGKEYDVIAEESFTYRIKRDDGKIVNFLKHWFEVVEDEVNNVDPVQSSIPEQCYLKVDNPSYSSLKRVLDMAYDQASSGKGKERHANDDNFEDQPICQIPRYQGSIDFVTGQAIKKCLEVTKLPTVDAKVRELLGAINYIAAGIIVLREGSDGK